MYRIADRNKRRQEARKIEKAKKPLTYKVSVRENFNRVEVKSDYLKYLRVVRFWMRKKHDIGLGDLEMLLFLYSENLFSRDRFDDYAKILSWDRSRFGRLVTRGDIRIWRKKKGAQATLYELSFRMKKIMEEFYKKLSGEEIISENFQNNPIFVQYRDSCANKAYRRKINKMNKERNLKNDDDVSL